MLMRVRATLASASVVAALGLVIRSLTQVLHRLREAEAAGAAEAARADAEAARKHELACELLTLRNLLISTPASVETRFVPAPSDKHVHFSWCCSTIAATTVWRLVRTSRLRQASNAAFAIASARAQVLLRRFSACLIVVELTLLSSALMGVALVA